MVFTGIAVAFAGGFLMIWFYGQDWFLNFSLFGENLRDLFQIHTINLSVAVWVGFIALFGIATDDGVVMATYLTQTFDRNEPENKEEIRDSIVEAGEKRIRPCLMTTATTILALLPILTSTGRGSDIMIPMAIPSFGGMVIALMTLFVVPVLFSWKKNLHLKEETNEKYNFNNRPTIRGPDAGSGFTVLHSGSSKNNPEIEAFELRYNIAEEKVNEVNTLPNTEVSAGYFVSEPETRTGAQTARFSVKQMIPWFGTITARENYAASLAEAEYVDITIAKRKLALSVSQSYYRLYSIRARQRVLEENIELLDTYERLALTSLEVGNASAVDVLRLQIRQNELVERKEVLGQDLAEQSIFNNLLNRDESMEVEVYDSLGLPSVDPIISLEDLNVHPELLKYDELYESVEQAEFLNQKESLPDLGFGVDYVAVTERPNMDFNDNGKDILMPMVSLSIPIFNNRYKSITKINELRQQEITAQKDDRRNELETLLETAISDRESARIAYRIQLDNLKQANDAEEILIKSYESATIDFNDVLDVQELQLKFQINGIESVRNYYVQMALINYLSNNN